MNFAKIDQPPLSITYCQLGTDFTCCSGISIVAFKELDAGLVFFSF